MNILLLRIRALLTLCIIGVPLYFIGKRLFRMFNLTSHHLKEQIESAKDRILLTPDPDEQPEDEMGFFLEPSEEDLPETQEVTEDDSLPDPFYLDTTTTETAIAGEDVDTQEEPPSQEIPQEDAQEQPEHVILEQPNKQSPSSYSAEKLAQTVEDIKYAALAYKERGKKDEYEKKLIEGISLIGDHTEFLIMLADHYFEEGHYVKAATLLKKIIQHNPENHRSIRQLGQIYAYDNDKETAKLLLEKARDLKDDNPKYLITLLDIYYDENNLKECISIVERLSKLRPTNIDYLLTLAKLHEELNQPTKAHAYYMKVLELNPLNDQAKQALKRLL